MSEFSEKILGRIQENSDQLIDINSLSRLINRELSWMEFNERVLEEARDRDNPLYERLNFLAISSSNLDEFFMVRVASLRDLIEAGITKPDPSGRDPRQQLSDLMERTHEFAKKQYSCLGRQLLPALEKEGISFVNAEELGPSDRAYLSSYFDQMVFPVLTPLAVDAGRPLPLISGRSINLLVLLEAGAEMEGFKDYPPFAIIQLPRNLARVIRLPGSSERLILLETIIKIFLDRLFDNVKIVSVNSFRVMRDADLEIDEEEASDLLREIQESLRQRQRGQVIRMEIESGASDSMIRLLTELFEVDEEAVFLQHGALGLNFLSAIPKICPHPEFTYPAFTSQIPSIFSDCEDYFSLIREQDVILHHPYESFDPVIRVIEQAARDPQVLAIKQTLYRVSGNSPIVAALAAAAESGKQVLVLVELKARFDEENNIHWAQKLERSGCHVIYGLRGLKTHSKITLIVREEDGGIRRYVHLGTGNYNDITARVYTDLGLWTSAEDIGTDATAFFNMLSGYSLPQNWNKLIAAPRWLRRNTLFRIRRETENAKAGKPAAIIAKINSLVDPEIIEALYEASAAGVKINLIVRGICCLRPGVRGLSENIEVRSIVGRFLEHSRIFYYYADGLEELFLSSADWMPRNLDRRVELLFPIEDEACRDRVFHILETELEDTVRARIAMGDGTYTRVDRRGRINLDSQLFFCEEAMEKSESFIHTPAVLDHYEPLFADKGESES